MLCLFCKEDSTRSRSVEHVIPESLGNTTLTLPPGVVCDKCNNYFARKVEKPLLDSIELSALRFHQGVPNKKGRIPPLPGSLLPAVPATVYRYTRGPFEALIDLPVEAIDEVFNSGKLVLSLPGPDDNWGQALTSRFLAKVALESMAARLVPHEGGVEYLATEPQFDSIRNFARRGGQRVWPYHSRRIYAADERWVLDDGEDVQRVWESDILHTDSGEWYFVLALFGLELTINYGGPEIQGYLEWLDRHKGSSPLYYGKNVNNPANGSRVSTPQFP